MLRKILTVASLVAFGAATFAGCAPQAGKDQHASQRQSVSGNYAERVARGEGFMPWQDRAAVSEAETAFRKEIETRKDRMLAERLEVKHPVMLTDQEMERARRNIEAADWASRWFRENKTVADYVVAQPAGYVADMISELAPGYYYGMTCPNCLGRKSQESAGLAIIGFDYRNPDVIRCTRCGQVYPDPKYPETAQLVCPRAGQVFAFYLNDEERRHPEDRSGKYAWQWVGRPMHVSFAGIIRQRRAYFMIDAAKSLALVYRLTGDARYAAKAVEILIRLARCYRAWLYHDYWDTIADCDPMYAAWHDTELRLEWKRHLCASAFRKDTVSKARMLMTYWGAGRLHPSCDDVTVLVGLCFAYDLVYDAKGSDGKPLWTPETRAKVERDLFMEWLMGAEPYLGGAGQATNTNNKAGRVYWPMAVVAHCLGIADWADTALRGFEAIEDASLTYDGFSHESPGYTFISASYMGGLTGIAEALHGFQWPERFTKRSGQVDLYNTHPRFRLLMRAALDTLRPDGRLLPLADTPVTYTLSPNFVEIGTKRCPEYYAGALGAICPDAAPTEYAVLKLDAKEVEQHRARQNTLALPEIYFPAWMTAVLRHGQGRQATVLALTFSPEGSHRQPDNLGVFYADRGDTILGEQGYVSDTPLTRWAQSTLSHNLVVVDDQEQPRRRRVPRLHIMATSPLVSVVEASFTVYNRCKEYRRLVALVKGPGAETFAVDIFRVKGGKKHAYRLFSELAASDAPQGLLEFAGVTMPPEEPLPQIAGSTRPDDIFGLRNFRTIQAPSSSWQAVWKQTGRRYRCWILSRADSVQASNGPGQEWQTQPMGRRVRYVDVICEGKEVSSTFVAIHEPSGPGDSMPVRRAERLDVPPQAGPNAVALRIESKWGTYSLFSDFAGEAVVDGMRFQGQFGLLCHAPDGQRRLLAAGATALRQDEFGFAGQPAVWDGPVRANTETALTPGTPRPAGFPDLPEGCQGYVLADDGTYWTGFPVERIGGDGITTRRFPLPKLKAFVLLALRYVVDGMGKRCQEPFPGTNDQGTLPPAPSVFQLPFPSAHFGETSPKMAIQGRCPAGSGMVGRKRRLPRS